MRRLSSTHVMLTIAMFVALGGASYAVIVLPENSVGTKQVKDHSLGVQDISHKAVRSLRGKAGPRGATGATGATGAAGATGPAGTNGTNGTNGTKGEKGDKGDTGPTGAKWASAVITADEQITTSIDLPLGDSS